MIKIDFKTWKKQRWNFMNGRQRTCGKEIKS